MKNIILINLFVAILCFLSGCGTSPPSKFYMLNSMPIPAEKAQLNDIQNRITIGVEINDIPSYLSKPQIVVRVNSNELKLEEFNRWAETVKFSFPKVVANNMVAILPENKFIVYARKRILNSDYKVLLNINQFDGTPGEKASLIVQWGIFESKNNKLQLTRVSNINVETDGNGFDKLVAAQSKAIEILSRQISSAIEDLEKK